MALAFLCCLPEARESGSTYPTYDSFRELVEASGGAHVVPTRVTSAGTAERPTDHGFFYYSCQPEELRQFDSSGRYMLALRVFSKGSDVSPDDKGIVGIVDLDNDNEWTAVGESTAWN